MSVLLSGGVVFFQDRLQELDILIDGDGVIRGVGAFPFSDGEEAAEIINCENRIISPGFVDVHVHLREPGFFMKETVALGTAAAAKSGYTALCAMPNLNPVPDCPENLAIELEIIRRGAKIPVYPYAAITKGQSGDELADFAALEGAIGFSDDGKGVQSREMMKKAMLGVKSTGKIIAAHCEDEVLARGGAIHDGEFAKKSGLPGIPSESEWRPIERDIGLLRETGCRYHVCHVSAKESVELIRRAKAEGIAITCETAPHYLLLCDGDLKDEGRFKMNPPIRAKDDRDALISGIIDGTIDAIATDHAPHTEEEKSRGLSGSVMGITGLETAFPALYTGLVKTGVVTLEKLIRLMSIKPGEIFGIGGAIEIGKKANIAILDISEKYKIDSSKFISKGKSTPFDGMEVCGECVMTIAYGETVWRKEGF